MKKLYEEHLRGKRRIIKYGNLLEFSGIEGLSVYNTTPPLWLRVKGVKKRIIAGRIERSEEWVHSRVMFFEEYTPFKYKILEDAPVLTGEDPSITTVNGHIVLSVVLVRAYFPRNGKYLLETVYYTGKDIYELEFMPTWTLPGKDNRLVEIKNSKIVVTTRPQGKIGGKGTIAYKELSSLSELSAESLKDAILLEGVFGDDCWGGSSELHWLHKSNLVAVVCHGAFQDRDRKIYFAGLFKITRDKRQEKKHTKLKIIAVRDDFPISLAKDSELIEVVFPGGIMFEQNKAPLLFAGLGDHCQGVVPLRDKEIVNLYNR